MPDRSTRAWRAVNQTGIRSRSDQHHIDAMPLLQVQRFDHAPRDYTRTAAGLEFHRRSVDADALKLVISIIEPRRIVIDHFQLTIREERCNGRYAGVELLTHQLGFKDEIAQSAFDAKSF